MAQTTVSIPKVYPDGSAPWFSRSDNVDAAVISQDILAVLEGTDSPDFSEIQRARLRAYIYSHYHPELKTTPRVLIYQTVKAVLENGNLNRLKNIAGIKQKNAYINTILNVGKRSSYFGGLIGVTVAGYFFLPPVIKWGILPIAKHAIRTLVPNQKYLTPIDNYLKLSKLVGQSPARIYSGIRKALGSGYRNAGNTVASEIDTTPMDDLTGNLFFRSLIEQSNFSERAKNDFRNRAQIAFLYDMARVSRQLEGLAQNPEQCWARISHYTNFAMFLKSMESSDVPIQSMLHNAVEIISRARIGSSRKNLKFYMEFERGIKNLNYSLQVVEPLDKFNEADEFDYMESHQAKLAFFEQNRNVMERLYLGHDGELARVKPMFQDFQKAAWETPPTSAATNEAAYQAFQAKISLILTAYQKPFKDLGKAELNSYKQELRLLGAHK